MDENNFAKLPGMRQTIRLKELLQKWQSAMLGSTEGDSPFGLAGIPPAVSERINIVRCACDSDEDGSIQNAEPPPDVPKGYLAVYVGPELRRFIIPTSYLSHNLFTVLLEKAEEEFGFNHLGGLTIPCEIETFKYLLKCMEKESQQSDTPADNSLDKQDHSDAYNGESHVHP